MKVSYKIDGNIVERSTFNDYVNDHALFNLWEKAIESNEDEIVQKKVSVSFKIIGGKMHVLTDTQLLFKLNYQVRKEMVDILKSQSKSAHSIDF